MSDRKRCFLRYAGLSLVRCEDFLRQWLGNQGYILLLSVVVGLLSGLAAVTLKTLTESCHHLARQAEGNWVEWIAPALPAAGILFCVILSNCL